MTNGNRCSKCSSTDLLRVPSRPGEEPHIVVGPLGLRSVAVGRFVCASCGYIEEWVDDVTDLSNLAEPWTKPPSSESQTNVQALRLSIGLRPDW